MWPEKVCCMANIEREACLIHLRKILYVYNISQGGGHYRKYRLSERPRWSRGLLQSLYFPYWPTLRSLYIIFIVAAHWQKTILQCLRCCRLFLLVLSFGWAGLSSLPWNCLERLFACLVVNFWGFFTYSGRGTYGQATPWLLNSSVTGCDELASNQQWVVSRSLTIVFSIYLDLKTNLVQRKTLIPFGSPQHDK